MKTILLADDDPLLIEVYANKLKTAGFELEVVQTGEEILAKLKERKFDLLLLDIVLPEISGWDILGKIKEQSSKSKNLKDLKIIILSNLGQKSEVEKALKLGAVRYLIKTHYTPSEVVEEVKKILG
jgi:two-component system phosphate regulon response regulator PhoB/two-component system alkaline phosphatase synthesis response regulator PhoP